MSTGDPWCPVHGFQRCGCAETAKLPVMGEILANPGDKVFLLAEREALLKDAERLSWLQKQLEKASYTGLCVFRWSTSGRGWRLHETSEEALDSFGFAPTNSVREAIDQAIERERLIEGRDCGIEGDSEAEDSGAGAEARPV